MSKSLGNLVFVGDLLKEWEPAAVRLALLDHHYRPDWEWTDEDMPRAARRLEAWRAAPRPPEPDADRTDGGDGPRARAGPVAPRRRSRHAGRARPPSTPRPRPGRRWSGGRRCWALPCSRSVGSGTPGVRSQRRGGEPVHVPVAPTRPAHHAATRWRKAIPWQPSPSDFPMARPRSSTRARPPCQLAESIGPRLAKAAVAATVRRRRGRPRRPAARRRRR